MSGSNSTKSFTEYDQTQILQKVYNSDGSLAVSSFVTAQVGNNIQFGYPDSTTVTVSFYENSTLIQTLTLVYTDSTQSNLSSVTRTA